jgi:hypothetical protein
LRSKARFLKVFTLSPILCDSAALGAALVIALLIGYVIV